MTSLTAEIIETLRPALRSATKAERLLNKYWTDRIALVWTTVDIHRAANETRTVLTEKQARELLRDLNDNYNPQYGLKWEDVSEAVAQSGLGRDIKRVELQRFIHHDVLVIDPPQRTVAGTKSKSVKPARKTEQPKPHQSHKLL